MLEIIYAIIALLALLIIVVSSLVLRRWAAGLLGRYAERRRLRFEPHVLRLLDSPAEIEPLQRGLRPGDRKLIKEMLLQQASQLKGGDRDNMGTVFEKTGYVASEMDALRSRRWWRRLEAAVNLGIMQSQLAVPHLIRAARDPAEDVRLAAVRALGQLNEPEGIRVLMDVIEEGDSWTGSSIIEVLESVEPEVAAGIGADIVARLASTANADARLLYVRLCGLLNIVMAVNPLLGLLRGADMETRISSARALGQLGDTAAVESLAHSLRDESWEVRAQAARALGALGDEQAVAHLNRALSDGQWWVRHNAANALRRLGEKGIEALQDASRSDESWPRAAAAQALAEMALGV